MKRLNKISGKCINAMPSEDTIRSIVMYGAGILFLAFAYSAQSQNLPPGFEDTKKSKSEKVKIDKSATISNPVAYLYVDGNLDDWKELRSFGYDSKDVSGVNNKTDWKEAYFSHNDKSLFIAIDKHKESELLYSHAIYLDTDNDPETGYQVCGIGADRMIQTDKVYIHAGKPTDYLWHPKGKAIVSIKDSTIEMEVPLDYIKKSENVKLVFIADNKAHNGDQVDYYPDQKNPGFPEGPWFTYDLSAKAVKVAPPRDPRSVSNYVTDLTIDGDISEWTPLTSFGVDGNDVSDERPFADWNQAWMANDRDNLYIGVDLESDAELSFAHTIYFDTDQNPRSGFQLYSIGADFLIQKETLYRYLGNGRVFNWDPVAKVYMSKKGSDLEIVVPRMTLNNPFQIRVGFLGDNALFGHDQNDWYPNNINGVLTEGDKYFVYYFSGPAHSSPIDLSKIDINR